MATYGKKASEKVEKTLHERKHGTLKSGGSGKKVTSRKQAIAIGLAEARREGAKVPAKKTAAKKTAAKKTAAKKTPAKKTAAKKTAAKKSTAKKTAVGKTATRRKSA
jgi:topoisomerase IA-like protein